MPVGRHGGGLQGGQGGGELHLELWAFHKADGPSTSLQFLVPPQTSVNPLCAPDQHVLPTPGPNPSAAVKIPPLPTPPLPPPTFLETKSVSSG
jgi:hypothetical protein